MLLLIRRRCLVCLFVLWSPWFVVAVVVVVVDVDQLLFASHNGPSPNSAFKRNNLTMGKYPVSSINR